MFSNLDNAVENGNHEVLAWDAMAIVIDLTCFAADCEDELPEDLLPHVAAWLAERKK